MCYKQKCKVVSLNLAHPVYTDKLQMPITFYTRPTMHSATLIDSAIPSVFCPWHYGIV